MASFVGFFQGEWIEAVIMEYSAQLWKRQIEESNTEKGTP